MKGQVSTVTSIDRRTYVLDRSSYLRSAVCVPCWQIPNSKKKRESIEAPTTYLAAHFCDNSREKRGQMISADKEMFLMGCTVVPVTSRKESKIGDDR